MSLEVMIASTITAVASIVLFFKFGDRHRERVKENPEHGFASAAVWFLQIIMLAMFLFSMLNLSKSALYVCTWVYDEVAQDAGVTTYNADYTCMENPSFVALQQYRLMQWGHKAILFFVIVFAMLSGWGYLQQFMNKIR